MRILALATINTFTLFIVLYINYRFGVGEGALPSVGEVSEEYNTLFTPAGYAFSIWGLIYTLLLVFLLNQWYVVLTGRKGQSIIDGGIWFFLSNGMNSLWIVVWTMEYMVLSVLVMFLLLFCLAQLVRKLNLEIYDAPFKDILTIWWPIVVYFGWITLAFMVNLAVVLKYSLGLNEFIPERTWVIGLIMISIGVFVLLTYYRNLRECALVGAWGLAAIAVAQWERVAPVAYVAAAGAGILALVAFIHALVNFKTSPIYRIFKPKEAAI
jgi:hypothetical protein